MVFHVAFMIGSLWFHGVQRCVSAILIIVLSWGSILRTDDKFGRLEGFSMVFLQIR